METEGCGDNGRQTRVDLVSSWLFQAQCSKVTSLAGSLSLWYTEIWRLFRIMLQAKLGFGHRVGVSHVGFTTDSICVKIANTAGKAPATIEADKCRPRS